MPSDSIIATLGPSVAFWPVCESGFFHTPARRLATASISSPSLYTSAGFMECPIGKKVRTATIL